MTVGELQEILKDKPKDLKIKISETERHLRLAEPVMGYKAMATWNPEQGLDRLPSLTEEALVLFGGA